MDEFKPAVGRLFSQGNWEVREFSGFKPGGNWVNLYRYNYSGSKFRVQGLKIEVKFSEVWELQ
jgi:hypothetical protein